MLNIIKSWAVGSRSGQGVVCPMESQGKISHAKWVKIYPFKMSPSKNVIEHVKVGFGLLP
jgi:hypothetical protein